MSVAPVIHVVDDDHSLRTSLLRLLGASGFETREYVSTGDFLLNPAPDRHGCVLLDVCMPGPSGLELQSALARQQAPLPIIFLTGHADVSSSVSAMKAGAVDFLTKPVEPEVLMDAISRALERDRLARAARAETQQLHARFSALSDREREVFNQIVAGKLNKQIAHELGIAERTLKAKRAHVMLKLKAGSVADLGKFAEQLRRDQFTQTMREPSQMHARPQASAP
ncbi:MAG: response regulator receiver protein [Hyphomicrobiales bacterium]|nr:response regulator receiver protein [Hyphomicrobiales bacterium]